MNKELSFAEQLMENHNNGLFTVVKDDDDQYTVFSTLDSDGDLRMSCWADSEQEALENIGEEMGEVRIDEDDNLTIVRTFSPSDYMKECGQKNTKEIKAAIETLKKAGMIVDGKILNLS